MNSRHWATALSRVDLLTTREREIFGLLGTGLTNGCIAIMLSITERTVKEHIRNLLAKLGLDSKVEAAIISALYQDTVCDRAGADFSGVPPIEEYSGRGQ